MQTFSSSRVWEAYGVHDRVFSMVWNVLPLSFVGLGLHLLGGCVLFCPNVCSFGLAQVIRENEKGEGVSIVFCKATYQLI